MSHFVTNAGNYGIAPNSVFGAATSILEMVIEDLIYIPMGQQSVMFNRPYMASTDYNAIEEIAGRLHDSRTIKLTPNMVNGYTSGILQHSSVPMPSVIDNSFVTSPKLIFILQASYKQASGIRHKVYMQGYTNYDGVTLNGAIDHRLLHYINTIIETHIVNFNTPLGVITNEKLHRVYTVSAHNGTQDLLYSQRPSDLYNNYETINLASLGSMGGLSDFSMSNKQFTLDPFDVRPICSDMGNNIATNYLVKTLNAGLINGKDKELMMNSIAVTQNYGPSDNSLQEPGLNDNPFIRTLSRLDGLNTSSNVFTFSALMSLDATIEQRFKLLNLTKSYVSPVDMATPEVGEYWHGQDPVTLKAYGLIEASVALASKFGFSKLSFTASNMLDFTGAATIFITGFNSFMQLEELGFNTLLELFKDSYINQIFLNETSGGVIPTNIEMYVDLIGTSKICLTYAGYPTTWYTIPTFANAAFTPILTVDKAAFDELSTNITCVVENILNSQGPRF
jgi:hypothetical protein